MNKQENTSVSIQKHRANGKHWFDCAKCTKQPKSIGLNVKSIGINENKQWFVNGFSHATHMNQQQTNNGLNMKAIGANETK